MSGPQWYGTRNQEPARDLLLGRARRACGKKAAIGLVVGESDHGRGFAPRHGGSDVSGVATGALKSGPGDTFLDEHASSKPRCSEKCHFSNRASGGVDAEPVPFGFGFARCFGTGVYFRVAPALRVPQKLSGGPR